MQNPKTTLIQALEKLKPHREMAEGFLAFVQSEECSEESVVQLMRYILTYIRTIQQAYISGDMTRIYAQHKEIVQQDIQDAETLLEQKLGSV